MSDEMEVVGRSKPGVEVFPVKQVSDDSRIGTAVAGRSTEGPPRRDDPAIATGQAGRHATVCFSPSSSRGKACACVGHRQRQPCQCRGATFQQRAPLNVSMPHGITLLPRTSCVRRPSNQGRILHPRDTGRSGLFDRRAAGRYRGPGSSDELRVQVTVTPVEWISALTCPSPQPGCPQAQRRTISSSDFRGTAVVARTWLTRPAPSMAHVSPQKISSSGARHLHGG